MAQLELTFHLPNKNDLLSCCEMWLYWRFISFFMKSHLRHCHSSFKFMWLVPGTHLFWFVFPYFLHCLGVFICGIGEEIVKINHHYLWLIILSSLCKPTSQCVPQDTHRAPYLFSPEECLPTLHPQTSRPSPPPFTRPLLIAPDISSGNSSSTSGCLSLNWFFNYSCCYYYIMGIPP